MGRKLRKDLPRVKKGLESVTSEEAKAFNQSGEITVAGVPLVKGDLMASLFVDDIPVAQGGSEYKSHSDGDVVVMMDCLVRPEYIDEALARSLATNVQKARKEARLQATDDVDVYLRTVSPEGRELVDRLLRGSVAETVVRVLKKVPADHSQMPEGTTPFYVTPEDSPLELDDQKVFITLVKLS